MHDIDCRVIVDAAGAWAERVAVLAGARPVGLTPMRRTAATIGVPAYLAAHLPTHPAVVPVDESFYFKPDAAAIMVSLSEESLSEPCDAYPEDIDVALALERFHEATIVPRGRPIATWAGLRTFAPDRLPVVGFDPEVPGFFWYAGQGGYGIQMSPALSALGAKLVLGQAVDAADLAEAFSVRRESISRARAGLA
jgi:D-arginine dehydrogenase